MFAHAVRSSLSPLAGRGKITSEPARLPPVQGALHQVRLDQLGDAHDGHHDHGQDDQLRAGLGAVAEAGARNAERHHLLAVADVERGTLAADAGADARLAQVDLDTGQDAERLALFIDPGIARGPRPAGHPNRNATTRECTLRPAGTQRFRLNRLPNLLSLSLTCPTALLRARRRSCADSRSSTWRYFFQLAVSASISALRSSGVSGPTRDMGGRTSVRCTMYGSPLLCSTDTRASPTCSSWMARSVSRSGFLRNVWAAARTAFCSLGVKALSACWMRLPSWAEMRSGTSPGLCVT